MSGVSTYFDDVLKNTSKEKINLQVDALKERIKRDQREIVFLSILRVAIERSEEFHSITKKKAEEAITEALDHVNKGTTPRLRFNNEGGVG